MGQGSRAPAGYAGVAARWLGLATAVAALAYFSIELTRETGRVAAFWPANALVLAVLLRARTRDWPWAMAAGYLGCLAANFALGDMPMIAFALSGFNQAEALAAAWMCRRLLDAEVDPRRPRHLLAFAASAVTGAALSALAASATLAAAYGAPLLASVGRWFVADALGLLIVTPALLALAARNPRDLAKDLANRQGALCLAALAAGFAAAFLTDEVPLYILVFPPLILCAFLLTAASTALLLLVTAAASVMVTILGLGTASRYADSPGEGLLILQMFLATATFCALSVAAVVASHQRANARLLRTQQQLRHLVDNSADIVVRLEADGVISWISPSCRRLGYEPEAMIGQRANTFIHPDDVAGVVALREALFAGRPATGEGLRFRIRRSDGSWEIVEGNPSIIRDGEGAAVSMVNVLRDVTAQVEMERELATSEARYRQLTEGATDIVACFNLEARFTYLSPSVETVLGYKPEELVGVSTRRIMHPDDFKRSLAVYSEQMRSDRPFSPFAFEYRAVHKDGHEVWLEAHPRPIVSPDTGEITGYQDIVRDVTDRRAMETLLASSEARYRELADALPDIVITLQAGRITYASAACRRLGFEPEEMIGRTPADFLHPDDLADALDRARDHAAGHVEEGRKREQRVRMANGEWVWMEGNPRPIRDENGVVREVLYAFRDVTHRRALEAQLIEARDAAEDAAHAKSEFMANMSHEIRTPLTAILGFTSLLKSRSDLDAAAEHQIARIAGAGQALLAIVNDILDFSKIEAGQMSIRPRPVSLDEALAESLALFEPQAAAKGISLKLESEGLPHAQVDSDRLRQVLLNLIGNGVKFTEAGGVTVVAGYDAARERLRITVRDTGPGMDEAQQKRLFQRFSQVDGSTTRRHGGTGLGLAICRGLVEAMGGEISVSSRPGEGSDFSFEIAAPRCEAPVAQANEEELADLAALRVLVVDDNPINREIVRNLLSSMDVEVTEAADGEEAVKAAQSMPYDIILMDIRMPNLDGPDATLKIRNQPGPNRGIPILAFTAEHDLERFGEQAVRGFDGKVGKPIDGAQMLSEIARHVALGVEVTDAA